MKKISLQQAILAVIGVSALTAYSSQASAIGGSTSADLGVFTGSTISLDSSAPFKSFSDYGAQNQGWVHTAPIFTLQVGDANDIANGTLFNVQLKMTGRGTLNLNNSGAAAMNNPSFAVWTAGAGAIDTSVSFFGHGWNPTRGINETGVDVSGNATTIWTNEMLGAAGVLDGHEGFIGYVNSGPNYTLINHFDPLGGQPQTESGEEVLDVVGNGALNTTSLTWLTNPGGSSTSFIDNYYRDYSNGNNGATVGTEPDYALMLLSGLKAGNYLIALGGSCPDFTSGPAATAACGNGSQFNFEVSAPAAVPVPGAVWLFGSAMAGLAGMSRRNQKVQA